MFHVLSTLYNTPYTFQRFLIFYNALIFSSIFYNGGYWGINIISVFLTGEHFIKFH